MRRFRFTVALAGGLAGPVLMSGCAGQQSALMPRGEDAAVQSTLFFVMLVGAVVLWLMLNDSIHHRGQLSVYERMAGGLVPSIYGPSADEPWM